MALSIFNMAALTGLPASSYNYGLSSSSVANAAASSSGDQASAPTKPIDEDVNHLAIQHFLHYRIRFHHSCEVNFPAGLNTQFEQIKEALNDIVNCLSNKPSEKIVDSASASVPDQIPAQKKSETSQVVSCLETRYKIIQLVSIKKLFEILNDLKLYAQGKCLQKAIKVALLHLEGYEYFFNYFKQSLTPATSCHFLLAGELGTHYTTEEGLKPLGQGSSAKVYLCKTVHSPEHPLLTRVSQFPKEVVVKKNWCIFKSFGDVKRVLREIKILRCISHPQLIPFHGLLPPARKHTFNDISMVFEKMDTDLYNVLQAKQNFKLLHIQHFFFQILCGLEYLHSAGICHRDLKPSNILVNSNCDLKIGDLGLARFMPKSPLLQRFRAAWENSRRQAGETKPESLGPSSNQLIASASSATGAIHPALAHVPRLPEAPHQLRTMSAYVVTRWYRAPELIFEEPEYTEAIDMWSAGCILAELLSKLEKPDEQPSPLFTAKTTVESLESIFSLLGIPSVKDTSQIKNPKAQMMINYMRKTSSGLLRKNFKDLFPKSDPRAIELLENLLQLDPSKRLSAKEALASPFFDEIRDEGVNPLFKLEEVNYPHVDEWSFEMNEPLSTRDYQNELLKEILLDHPELEENYAPFLAV